MKVRVYTDYSPIRIMRGVNKKEFTEPTDVLAEKMGLVGAFVEVDESEIPSDRTNRNCWIVDGKKVKEDSVKVAEKLSKEAEKLTKRNTVLSKLKITESELADLFKG